MYGSIQRLLSIPTSWFYSQLGQSLVMAFFVTRLWRLPGTTIPLERRTFAGLSAERGMPAA
jgi:hypothetical protein